MPEANAPAAAPAAAPTAAPTAAPGAAPAASAPASSTQPTGGEQSTLLGDAKPAGDKGTEGADDKGAQDGKADAKTEGAKAPVEYAFTMPEGVELDKAAASEFSEVAKELKLSPENAQKVADVAVKMAQRQAADFATTVKGWETQSRADAEFGGDALEANMAIAQSALDTYGSPALLETMKAFGMLNHPEVIRLLFKVGKATKSDDFVKGGQAGATNIPLANRMYPNQK